MLSRGFPLTLPNQGWGWVEMRRGCGRGHQELRLSALCTAVFHKAPPGRKNSTVVSREYARWVT